MVRRFYSPETWFKLLRKYLVGCPNSIIDYAEKIDSFCVVPIHLSIPSLKIRELYASMGRPFLSEIVTHLPFYWGSKRRSINFWRPQSILNPLAVIKKQVNRWYSRRFWSLVWQRDETTGATVWYSDFYHDDIFITQCPTSQSSNSSRCIGYRSILANNGTGVTLANATSATTQYFSVPEGLVTLAIKAEDVRYSFGYNMSGGETTWVGSLDSIWLFTAPAGCAF